MTVSRPDHSHSETLRQPRPFLLPALRSASLGVQYRGTADGAMRGDFFDLLLLDDQRILFFLLDLTALENGQHARPLHIMAQVQDVFRQQGRDMSLSASENESDLLMQLMPEINRALMAAAEDVHPATAVLGCYNQQYGLLTYINAGAQPMIVRNNDGIRTLETNGLPMGLFTHSTYEAQVLAMEPGAALVMASKGVVEARCHKEIFGIQRVSGIVESALTLPAQALCDSVLQAAWKFRQQASRFGPSLRIPDFKQDHLNTDMTVVALVRHKANADKELAAEKINAIR